MRFVVRGISPEGREFVREELDVNAALHEITDLRDRGYTGIRLIETRSGEDLDIERFLNPDTP